MTIEQCQKCSNYGVFGACRVEQTSSGDWSCNFVPKNGSVTIVVNNGAWENQTRNEQSKS